MLAAALAVSVVACGDDGDDSGAESITTGAADGTTTVVAPTSSAPATGSPATSDAPATTEETTGPTTGAAGEGDLDVAAVLLTPEDLPPPGELATTWNTIGGAETSPELYMLLGCGPAVEPPGQPVIDYGNVQFARDFDLAAHQDVQELVTVIQRAWELTDASTALEVVRSEVEACTEVAMPDSERVLRREVVELGEDVAADLAADVGADGVDALMVRVSASGGGLDDARIFELWARRGDVVTSVETVTAAAVSEQEAMQPLLEAVVARLAGGSASG